MPPVGDRAAGQQSRRGRLSSHTRHGPGARRCLLRWPGDDAPLRLLRPARRPARARAPRLRGAARAAQALRGRGRRARRRAACCWPRPAPAPARRSPTCCRRSTSAGASWSRPAPRTCRSSSSRRTSRSWRRRWAATLNVAVMKGRANYLCLLRLASFSQGRHLPPAGGAAALPGGRGVGAARARPATAPRSRTCPTASSSGARSRPPARTASASRCSLFESCFVTKMRQRALEADIVVVNHHLLCADLAVKDGNYGQVIPDLRHRDPRRGAPDRGRGDALLRRRASPRTASRTCAATSSAS